ncbi:MAG: DUF4150 domain-containing protein, partial [Gammaproteobacteria bacterium]|nr:DUF4150 domain-containing protein [Gammaproteobacteria bacterium]
MAVIVNGKTVVYAGSGGILVTQDVCLTGDDKVPVTYNNVAKSADAANTDSGVLINGNPICTVNSYF